MTTDFNSLLREQHQRFVEEGVAAPKAALQQARRPGAATASIAGVPEVEYLPYGPQESIRCEIVSSLGEVEAEYAAIRRAAGIMDCPNRATLRITGSDRRDFLNRLLTAELKDLGPGTVRPAFWLNRKGRIDADMLLVERNDDLLVDLDIHQAEHTVSTLNEFLFAEDVEIRNVTDELYRVCLHGPRAMEVIAAAGDDKDFALDNLHCARARISGHDVTIARLDQAGTIGLHLFVHREHVPALWERLVHTDRELSDAKRRIRPIGWFAFNIARLEAGTPLFNIDFGPTNLPHESGLLHERVSFTKGCYLGQEVVARMENLGKPKQMLIGLRLKGDNLPVAGTQVFAADKGDDAAGDPVGVITSSTLSPMLGATPIAFAMVKTKHAAEGSALRVYAEGEPIVGIVHPLRFWPEREE